MYRILIFREELNKLRISNPELYSHLNIDSDFPLNANKNDLYQLSPEKIDKILSEISNIKYQINDGNKKQEIELKKKDDDWNNLVEELYNIYI